ncbi:MAG: hypothetical protein P1Q69_11030, partial [Candidatus Thorarchaeota archaeon]|nr:hypothetical protein [Candidatus Thorarchaeota archaeon]
IEVYGKTTILSIGMNPIGTDIIAEEYLTLDFLLQDIQSTFIEGALIHVTLVWDGQETEYELINGVDDTILFTPMTNGVLEVAAWYEGNNTYEPTSYSIDIDVLRRPVTVELVDLPEIVYPNVGPSYLMYPVTITISDALNSFLLSDTTVLLCYIFENETVYQPIWNATGYINSSLVQEYLAWGLFRIIGSATTDESGIVNFVWEVEMTSEQKFKVFAITLQTDIHETGISSVFEVSYQKIPTSLDLESSWDGDGKKVTISTELWDPFTNQINGVPIQVYITSYQDPTSIIFKTNVTTGFNSTFEWEAPEFGAYYIFAQFQGDAYYESSGIMQSTVVVSWRLIEIVLELPTAAYPGETIQMTARVIDLNASDTSPLLEILTVYFVYFEDGELYPIGRGDTDSMNSVECSWTVPDDLTFYNVFAYTERQIAYETGKSNFHQISIRPFFSYLDIQVNSSVECFFNFSYSFQVSLTDENGNSLVGEVVNLYLTDNYTEFWGEFNYESEPSKFSISCDGDPHYHVYKLAVIIGYNDTFTWYAPGRVSDRILFSPRAIAIGFYDGSSTHFPTALTRKMSSYLIETDVDLIFDEDPRAMHVGIPQEIGVNVTNECGDVLYRGKVIITIMASNGEIFEYLIDLEYNSMFLWTPMRSDTYTISAEYQGAELYGCHESKDRGRWHWRHRNWREILYTRSFNVTGMVVYPELVDVFPNQILNEYTTQDTLVLSASIVSNLGLPLGGTSISFYYLDSTRVLHLIGTSTTNAAGYAELSWNLTGIFAEIGYEALNIFVEVDSYQYNRLSWITENIVKVWLEEESYIIESTITPAFVESTTATPDVVSPVVMIVILSILAMPASILSRRNRKLLMLLAAVLFIFCTTSILYTGLGVESAQAPFSADLIFDMSINPSGPNVNPFSGVGSNGVEMKEDSLLGSPIGTGTISSTPLELEIQPGFSTGSPNASYVIVPMMNAFEINFTAYGYYVVSILDEDRTPVDTVAGYAEGPVEHSFLISSPKYSAGSQYTVNTFVTAQRYGITYGDNSWIVMNVARCTTRMDLVLEPNILQYTPDNHTLGIATKLLQLRTNQSIEGEDIHLSYRSSLNLEWHDIAVVKTDTYGIAHYQWEVSLPKDSYVINATFEGSERFDSSTTVDMVTIDGAATQLGPAQYQASKYWVQYSHPETLHTQLLSHSGIPLYGKAISFIILRNDTEHWFGTNRTDMNGMATLTYLPYVDTGVYDFRVEFAGDDEYAASSYIFEDGLNILRRSPHVTLLQEEITSNTGDSIEISAKFTDDLDLPIRAENASLEIYDLVSQTWQKLGECETAPSGLAAFDYIVDVSPGQYVYRIILQGTNQTARISKQGLLTVREHLTYLYFIPATAEYGQRTDIMAHLQDGSGYPLEGSTILYYIEVNSKWIPIGSAASDSSGWARLSWVANYGEGKYNLKTVFPGSISESSAEFIGEGISIAKATSKLSMSVSRKVQYSLPAQVNLTLTDSVGTGLAHKAIGLTVTADGIGIVEEVTLYTDQEGFTSYHYVPPYLGMLTVDAIFEGDENYVGDSVSDNLVTEKMELAISLVVSATDVHRGDIIQFSGEASIVVDDDIILPADEGIDFILQYLDGTPVNEAYYSIITILGGKIVGSWTIPKGGNPTDIIQAGDYAFKVVTPDNIGAKGETTFDLTVIERTYLTAAVEQNGAEITKQYVDQNMDFRFVLLDEDGTPLTNTELVYFIEEGMHIADTDGSGTILDTGFIPDVAGGYYSSVSYAGSKYFDPDFADVSFSVYRRSISVELFETDAVYYQRDDLINLNFNLIDSLIESDLLETIDVVVFVDGGKIAEFVGHDGFDSVASLLPDDLQAGPHEVFMRVRQNRVYNDLELSRLFYAYEDTKMLLQVPDILKTNTENTLRIQLTDIDGSPLRERYVTLSIYSPTGDYTGIDMKTDSFGEAFYEWTPGEIGEYEFEAWFGGESLFEETTEEAIPYTTKIVQEGGGKTESGNSPLWLLPLMLLALVNIALEYLTFGCVGFLMASGDLKGKTMSIKRISYPSIRIQKFNVTIWPFGQVEIAIPIPYIYTETDIKVDSDETTLHYRDAPNEESVFDIKSEGMDTDDGLPALIDAFFNALGGDAAGITPIPMPEKEYNAPSRSKQSSGSSMLIPAAVDGPLSSKDPALTSSTSSLNINILKPEFGASFQDVGNVTVRWTVDYPIGATDYGCIINIDNGGFQPATIFGTPEVVEDGTIRRVTYENSFDAMNEFGDIQGDNLDNGAHRVKIIPHADGITETASTVFYIFNWWPVIFAAGAFFIAFIFGLIIEKILEWSIAKFILKNEAIPKPYRAALWAVSTILGSVIIFVLLSLILDLLGAFLCTNLWIFPILGFPVGLIFGIIFLIVGIFTIRAAAGAANAPGRWKEKRKNSYDSILKAGLTAILVANVIYPVIMTILDENVFNGIPD